MMLLPGEVPVESIDPLASVFLGSSIILIGAALAGLFTGFVGQRRGRRAMEMAVEAPLEAKLARVVALSTQLNALNKEVQAEFDLQIAATERAKVEAQQAEALAALSKEQRDAAAAMVKAALDSSLATNGKKDRRFQIVLSVVSFLLGVVVALTTPWLLGVLGLSA